MDSMIAELAGALLGAAAGAFGALWVARSTLHDERTSKAHDTVLALADEARFNANVLRHREEHFWDALPSALERQAFDAALPVLHVLRPDLSESAREVRNKILFMMYVERMLADKPGASGPAYDALVDNRNSVLATLPEDLSSLADDVTAYVADARNSRFQRRAGRDAGRRSDRQEESSGVR